MSSGVGSTEPPKSGGAGFAGAGAGMGRLVAALAARLGPVSLPSRVTEEWLTGVVAPVADDVEAAAREALLAVQDEMVEATGLPWPQSYPDWGAGPPIAAARIEGTLLRLGYGDPARPALELEPIPLDELL